MVYCVYRVSSLCLLVHEPPYQTTVVCYNSVFLLWFFCIDHHTILHIRVWLAQAYPNSYTYKEDGFTAWVTTDYS